MSSHKGSLQRLQNTETFSTPSTTKLQSQTQKLPPCVSEWTNAEVCLWAQNSFSSNSDIIAIFRDENLCGQSLLALTESDLVALRRDFNYRALRLGDIKRIWIQLKQLQRANCTVVHHQTSTAATSVNYSMDAAFQGHHHHHAALLHHDSGCSDLYSDRVTPPCSIDGRATCKPDLFKTIISLGE